MKCSDCQQFKTDKCETNPAGIDHEPVEQLSCFVQKHSKDVLEKQLPQTASVEAEAVAIPPEVKGWNWGAFLLPIIWGLSHRVWLSLLCFIPFVNIVIVFVLGAKGNEWAWQNQKWNSIEHFKKTQRKWALWGLGLLVFGIVLFIVTVLAAGSEEYAPSTTPLAEPKSTQIQPEPTSNPSLVFQLSDMVYDSRYWNSNWDATSLHQTLISTNWSYYQKHTYIKGVFDCDDMAIDIWNILYSQGITSAIVIGNLDMDKEKFSESNHTWLLILHNDRNSDKGYRIFVIEPTNGETYGIDLEAKDLYQYLQGYYFASPSDLRTHMR